MTVQVVGVRPVKVLPGAVALVLAAVAGVASAAQSMVNAGLGERVGSAAMGAVVNNLGGSAIILVGLLVMPSMRAGLAALRTARLPWWVYLGALGGAGFVLVAAYVVPVLGVAAFTIAQVTGNNVGGLGVDRAGLGPLGRLALTGPRVAGALLGVAAVALAQLGRSIGELALGMVLLAVVGGVAVALQAALNGRVSAAVGAGAGVAINFAIGTPVLLAVAAAVGAFAKLGSTGWPSEWYLYIGGLFGVCIVAVLLVSVPSVGVLRTGLAMVAGQLGGALLLDTLLPGGPGASLPVLAGALLTLLAVVVSGRSGRSEAAPAADGRLGS
ncbi:MAG TPA: DMT family transporter [Micromonosporaceae bacterium]|nr:DMT family transporter [Micromonosporaceae bacterium]